MDDFSDLLWTAPTPNSTNRSPSNQSQESKVKAGGSFDTFSILANAANVSKPTANYHGSGSGPPSRSLTPSVKPPATSATKPPTGGLASSDVFSSLWNANQGASSQTSLNSLSIAERQAKAEQERLEKLRREKEVIAAQGAFWDKFDQPTKPKEQLKSAAGPGSHDPFSNFGLGEPQKKPPPSSAALKPVSSSILKPSSPAPFTTNLNGRSNAPAAPKSATPTPSVSVWDFDMLGASDPKQSASSRLTTSTSQPSVVDDDEDEVDLFAGFDHLSSKRPGKSPSVARTASPRDFDDAEELTTGSKATYASHEDQDDILGLLSQPVRVIEKGLTPSPLPHQPLLPADRPSPRGSPRPPSPPPHVIGRIVEMGFSVQQAKVALAATDSGINVEAALEILLTQGGAGEESTSIHQETRQSRSPLPFEDEETRNSQRVQDEAERRRRRRAGPSRANTTDGERGKGVNTSGTQDEESPLQDQTDKILAQATEIGLNVFNRANAFWQSSKEIAAKVIEERTQTTTSGGKRADGRPKWMVDEGTLGDDKDERPSPSLRQPTQDKSSGFKDDGDFPAEKPGKRPAPREQPDRSHSKRGGGEKPRPAEQQQPATESLTGSLFSVLGLGEASSSSTGYVSSARRKATRPLETPISKTSNTAPPKPKPRRRRELFPCPSQTLSASTTQRVRGTSEYKLGQYAAADASFTSAIDLLPAGHWALIPLWNNRAQARLKTGSHTEAVQDCSEVIRVIGADFKETEEEPIPTSEEHGPGVSLGEALVKAYSRRASAFEMGEKWEKAKEDWEKLVVEGPNFGQAGVRARSDAVRGLERCKKMMSVVGSAQANGLPSSSTPVPKPRPKPKPPVPARPAPPSEAADRLKAANAAADAEENQRYALKDTVEARLIAWKGGKESNIRALIASLESVLWPELGWVKVGMAELVTGQQVKVRYMKAIAKLHPDKVRNASVEQRMIANGVFSALNDAYNVFKP